MKFWDKVKACKHDNLSENYVYWGDCPTTYCQWIEKKCLDCGVFIVTCGCGYCNDLDGWPYKRRVKTHPGRSRKNYNANYHGVRKVN